MPGDKPQTPTQELASIAAEYFRPSGVPRNYADNAVKVHAANLETRLAESVEELIASRDFKIAQLVKALEAITKALAKTGVRKEREAEIQAAWEQGVDALTAAGRKP